MDAIAPSVVPAVTTETEGDTLSVKLKGDFTLANSRAAERALSELPVGGAKRVALDLADVHDADSSGAWLIHRTRAQTEYGGRYVWMCNPSPELKFLLDEAGTRKLKSRLKTLEIAVDTPRTRLVRTIYYDTPEQDLRRSGIAVRMRRDGRRWIQTVKIKARHDVGLAESAEYDSPAPGGQLHLGALPDEAIRDRIVGLVGDKVLEPVCETAMRRISSLLRLQNGAEAELAIDSGEIKAAEKAEPFREAEIELISGGISALFDLTQTLFPSGGLRFSMMSKAERGYLLATEGRVDAPLVPRNAETVPLVREQSAETAARDVLRECFEQIAANAAVVQGHDDHEGPHQLRIGLRRLRSALTVF